MRTRPAKRAVSALATLAALATAAVAGAAAVGGAGAPPQGPRPPLLGLDLYVPQPDDNPSTAEKVALGRTLFHDAQLSRDGTIACVSCHVPEHAFADGEPVAIGVEGRRGTRNAPTLINRAWGRHQFWDGRAASIEAQILASVQSANEMDMPLPELERRISADAAYRDRFAAVFGAGESDPITSENIARAIAAYVRTIVAGDSPFDRYQFGDREALSEAERRGMELFFGDANCWRCHAGPNLTDEQFHNTGVAWRPAAEDARIDAGGVAEGGARTGAFADVGRFAASNDEGDLGAFKTPTLRELARTAPYMHDGSFATLDQVVDFYDRGGNPNPHLDHRITPLNLAPEDKASLVGFLRSLTGVIREGSGGARNADAATRAARGYR